jgi:hypothetical protein
VKRAHLVLSSFALITAAVWVLCGWPWAVLALGALVWIDAYPDTWFGRDA